MAKHWDISPHTFEDYEHADVNHHTFHRYKQKDWISLKYADRLLPHAAANPHPCAIEMVQKHFSRTQAINLWDFASNPHPYAIRMLQQNPNKLHMNILASNPHPWAIETIQKRKKCEMD